MSNVHDEGLFQSQPGLKMEPSFRQEDQEMAATLKPQIVSPPGYASPDPSTAAGRLVPVEHSVLPVAEDYGASVREAASPDAPISETVAPESTLTPEETMRADAKAEADDLPENREEWSKKNWQTQARAMGLSEKGNKDDLQARVEDAEKEIEDAKELSAEDWKNAVDDAESAEELAELRRVYGAAGIDYSTVAKAFDDKQAEFDAAAAGNGNGDKS